MSFLCLSLLLAAPQYTPLQPISLPVTTLAGTVAGDFDSDGDVDLIALDRFGDGSVLLEALTPGEFEVPRRISFGGRAIQGGVAGDVTGDGNLDLVIATRISDERILVVEGRGDGTFESPRALGGPGDFNGSPLLVDLNQDGRVDILASGRGSFGARLTLYQNLGLGVFAPARQLSGDPSNDAKVLDVDGDGDLDILVGSRLNNLTLFVNDGAEGFAYGGVLGFFSGTEEIELIDLDGDGDLDVITNYRFEDLALAFENLGGGAFGARREFTHGLTGIARIAVVDVDRDGQDDLVAFSGSSETPIWMRNEPGFMLGGPQALSSMSSFGTRGLNVIDLNSDGILDFAISAGGDAVRTLQSDASLGTVPYGASDPLLTQAPGMNDVVALDLDGDGDLDVVGVTESGELFLAEGRGFSERRLPVSLGITAGSTLEAADLDGDGDVDLVAMDSQRRAVMFENTGTGVLTERVLTPGAISFSQRFELADMDGDGQLDIVGIGDGFDVVVVTQIGGGLFSAPTLVASYSSVVRRIMLADVNDDGRTDISVVLESPTGQVPRPRRIAWLEGLAGGGFAPSEELIGDTMGISRPIPFDLNGQGFIEFIWMSSAERASVVATSAASTVYAVADLGLDPGGSSARFAIGDLRGNGLGDLVVAGGPGNGTAQQTLRVYSRSGPFLNQLAGVLAEGLRDVRSIRFTDLDGDGDEDILLASGEGPQLAWIENLRKGEIGINYCGPAVVNSEGQSAVLSAVGEERALSNNLTLRGAGLPSSSTSFFLVSQTQDFASIVVGSSGALCLGGAIGRYSGAGQVQTVSGDGTIRLDLDLTAMPQPNGAVPALAGTLWFFQAWYRDVAAGQPTSNFTDGLAVVFE